MNSSKTAQHTPGGLHVWDDPETARIQLRSGSHTVASVHINGFQGPKQALEFARLIAAAPDLLEACRDASDQGQHADGCPWWDYPIAELNTERGRATANASCNCFVATVRAAIAKAEGGAA